MNKLFKRKGGFSLMEAVVAMAIVVLVTASALTIATFSTSSRVKSIDKNKAINASYNIIECFKVSTDAEAFQKNFSFAENKQLILTHNGDNNYHCSLSINSFNIAVEIEDDFSEIHVTVTDDTGKEIVGLEYSKYIANNSQVEQPGEDGES